MKCKVCGNEAENPQFKFCLNCGAELDITEEKAPPKPAAKVKTSVKEKTSSGDDGKKSKKIKSSRKKNGNGATAIVSAASALILLGSGEYIAYNNGLISFPASEDAAEASEAAAAINNGDYEKAAQLYEKAIAKTPDKEEYYLDAAEAYLSAGAQDEAINCLSRGVMKTGSSKLAEKLYSVRENASPIEDEIPVTTVTAVPVETLPTVTEETTPPEPVIPPMPDIYMPVFFGYETAIQVAPEDINDVDIETLKNTTISITDNHNLYIKKALAEQFQSRVQNGEILSETKSFYSHSGNFDDLQDAGSTQYYGGQRAMGTDITFDENGRILSKYDHTNRVTTDYYYVYGDDGLPLRRYSTSEMMNSGVMENVGMDVFYFDYTDDEKDDGNQYDSKGRLISSISGNVTTEYVYDDENGTGKILVNGVHTATEWYDYYGQPIRYEKLADNDVVDNSEELNRYTIGRTKRFEPFENEEPDVTYKNGGCIITYEGTKDFTRSWSEGFLPDYTHYSSDYNFLLTHMTAALAENDDTKAFSKDVNTYIKSANADSIVYRDKDGYITAVEIVKNGQVLETFTYSYTRDSSGYPVKLDINGTNRMYSTEFAVEAIICEPMYDENGNPVIGRYKDKDGNVIGTATAEYVLWNDEPADEIADYLEAKGGTE